MASTSMTISNLQPATLDQFQVINSIRLDLQTIPANTFTLIAYQESGTHYHFIIDLNDHPISIKSKLSEYLWKHFKSNFDPAIVCSFSISCPCLNCAKIPKPPNFDKL